MVICLDFCVVFRDRVIVWVKEIVILGDSYLGLKVVTCVVFGVFIKRVWYRVGVF